MFSASRPLMYSGHDGWGVVYAANPPVQQYHAKGRNPVNSSMERQYRLGEHVGSENRHLEFKAGPAFMDGLRQKVARYMCAFINANVDGILMIGVADDGLVRGYSLTQHEKDSFLLKVDEAMKELNPKVFPQSYSIQFVAVVNEYGQYIKNQFVIEISIKGTSVSHDSLYSCNEAAFMRRDAGVQKLTPQDIQQWVKQNVHQESNGMRKELNKEKNQHLQKIGNLERTLSNLKNENAQLKTEVEVLKFQLKQRREMEQEHAANNDDKVTNQEVRQELAQMRDLIEQQQQEARNKSKVCNIM